MPRMGKQGLFKPSTQISWGGLSKGVFFLAGEERTSHPYWPWLSLEAHFTSPWALTLTPHFPSLVKADDCSDANSWEGESPPSCLPSPVPCAVISSTLEQWNPWPMGDVVLLKVVLSAIMGEQHPPLGSHCVLLISALELQRERVGNPPFSLLPCLSAFTRGRKGVCFGKWGRLYMQLLETRKRSRDRWGGGENSPPVCTLNSHHQKLYCKNAALSTYTPRNHQCNLKMNDFSLLQCTQSSHTLLTGW